MVGLDAVTLRKRIFLLQIPVLANCTTDQNSTNSVLEIATQHNFLREYYCKLLLRKRFCTTALYKCYCKAVQRGFTPEVFLLRRITLQVE